MNDTQKACSHVFIGKSDGVHCIKCGLFLTPEEYREHIAKGKEEKKSERVSKTGSVHEDSGAEPDDTAPKPKKRSSVVRKPQADR